MRTLLSSGIARKASQSPVAEGWQTLQRPVVRVAMVQAMLRLKEEMCRFWIGETDDRGMGDRRVGSVRVQKSVRVSLIQ